jgi:hypothetical protein
MIHGLFLPFLMMSVAATPSPTPVPTVLPVPKAAAEPTPEPTLVLAQVVNPARMIGTPRVCSEPDENGEIPICLMELYEADMLILRHWNGPVIPRRLRVRFTAHSMYVFWRRNVRFILRVQPFVDQGRSGHFAFFWDWEDERGRFCEGTEELQRPEYEPLRAIYARGRQITIAHDNNRWSAGSQLTCVTGRERTVR